MTHIMEKINSKAYSYVNTSIVNPLNAELNPICHLLATLTQHIFHVSGLRVNLVTQISGIHIAE